MITIIMPLYYKDKVMIKEALISIMNQTYKFFTLHIIINGINKNLKDYYEIIENYYTRKKIVSYLRDANIVRALNYGIINTNSKYIARQDSDDFSEPNRIEKQIEFLENNKDIIGCGTQTNIINLNGLITKMKKLPCKINEIKKRMKTNNCFIHGSMMLKTKILKSFLYSNLQSHKHVEDYELWLRMIFKHNLKLENINEYLYNYRINNDSIIRNPENFNIFMMNNNTLKKDYCNE